MLVELRNVLKGRIKAALQALRASRRIAQLQESQPHVDRAGLARDLRAMGVEAGDTLFVHSSLKSLGFVEGGPEAVVAALQDAVGPEGNLLLPTYYLPGGTILTTCQMTDYVFDKRIHGSNMGALPRAFLATPGVRRSIHPTHSVSALGPLAAHLTGDHHRAPSVFGPGSPWQRFAELPRGKVLGLGISMGPVTFYHLAEDTLGADFPVPVWIDREYKLPCIDDEGQACVVPVRPYDPAYSSRRIDHKSRSDLRDWFAREFEAVGLKQNAQVGQARSWLIPGPPFLAHLLELAARGITIYSSLDQLPPLGEREARGHSQAG